MQNLTWKDIIWSWETTDFWLQNLYRNWTVRPETKRTTDFWLQNLNTWRQTSDSKIEIYYGQSCEREPLTSDCKIYIEIGQLGQRPREPLTSDCKIWIHEDRHLIANHARDVAAMSFVQKPFIFNNIFIVTNSYVMGSLAHKALQKESYITWHAEFFNLKMDTNIYVHLYNRK